MSIEQENVVDIISDGTKPDEVNLYIIDHFPWDEHSSYQHVMMLQTKINSYLAFIESGEIYEKYPEHIDKSVIIIVLGKYPLSDKAKEFYEKASCILANVSFLLRFEYSP